MIEVEQKYRVDDVGGLLKRLRTLDATESGEAEEHADTYYNHPARDFAETSEAFRVRRVNGVAWMTYKGSKLPGPVKARREIELRVGQNADDAQAFETALQLLSFRRVATVQKQRRTFKLQHSDDTVTIAMDNTKTLGNYAELEIVVDDEQAIETARHTILAVATRLGLKNPESRSYLAMQLETEPDT